MKTTTLIMYILLCITIAGSLRGQSSKNEAITITKDINAERVLIRFIIPKPAKNYYFQVSFVADDPNVKIKETTGTGKVTVKKENQEMEASWFYTRDGYTLDQVKMLKQIEIQAINTYKIANDYRTFLGIGISVVVATGGTLLFFDGNAKERDAKQKYDLYARNKNPFDTGNPDFPNFKYGQPSERDVLFETANEAHLKAQRNKIIGASIVGAAGISIAWIILRKKIGHKKSQIPDSRINWLQMEKIEIKPVSERGGYCGLGMSYTF